MRVFCFEMSRSYSHNTNHQPCTNQAQNNSKRSESTLNKMPESYSGGTNSSRPSLARSTGSKELTKTSHSFECKDWNARRSSVQKQPRSKQFADGKCLTKSWINDDLSDFRDKLLEREDSDKVCQLSHIFIGPERWKH
jgi:hypothetical protein